MTQILECRVVPVCLAAAVLATPTVATVLRPQQRREEGCSRISPWSMLITNHVLLRSQHSLSAGEHRPVLAVRKAESCCRVLEERTRYGFCLGLPAGGMKNDALTHERRGFRFASYCSAESQPGRIETG